jgi:hypothetical protein
MFPNDLLATYTAVLEREIATLVDIEALAGEQRVAIGRDDLIAVGGLAVRRAALMDRLGDLEIELGSLRVRLAAEPRVSHQAGYRDAEQRGGDVRAIARRVLDGDRILLRDIEAAVEARRREAHDLDTGGVTLAAYRRVVLPTAAPSGLLDQRG